MSKRLRVDPEMETREWKPGAAYVPIGVVSPHLVHSNSVNLFDRRLGGEVQALRRDSSWMG